MEIGKTNNLIVARKTDFGYYLEDESNNDVLLPNSYSPEDLKISDKIEVFIYKDSEDRIIATTLQPKAQSGDFAFLQVKDVNIYGAFMEWGLSKDLLVPYAEQTKKMDIGDWHLIYIKKDELTDRLIGSCKINKFVNTNDIQVTNGDKVELLIYKMTELGMNVIVNNKYKGLIFTSDIHKDIIPGEKVNGYVKQVRDDGKLDIVLEPIGYEKNIDKDSVIILAALNDNDGFLSMTDKSSPEIIKQKFGMSKKAFKKAIGNLYKQKIVLLNKDGIKLIKQ